MLASTVHRLGPRGPGQHGLGAAALTGLPQLSPGQQLGVDRRDLRQHRGSTCSPRASRARTTATSAAGTYRARPRPAGFGVK